MLTEEDDVEIQALAKRGWSVSAIPRHTGRDRKTVRKYLAAPKPSRESAPSCLEPFRNYLAVRFVDDAHVDGTVLFREVAGLGFERRSCASCAGSGCARAARLGGHGATVELAHAPGEEIQFACCAG